MIWVSTFSHNICPKNKLLNINQWSWYHFFLRRSYLIHWYQLLRPHIAGSMPFRFFLGHPVFFLKGLFMANASVCYLESNIAVVRVIIETWLSQILQFIYSEVLARFTCSRVSKCIVSFYVQWITYMIVLAIFAVNLDYNYCFPRKSF